MGTLKPQSNGPAIRWLVHWPLMGGLLYLVQWGGAWAGWGPAQSPPRCTKCNSPPINGQCANSMLFDVALSLPLNSKGSRISIVSSFQHNAISWRICLWLWDEALRCTTQLYGSWGWRTTSPRTWRRWRLNVMTKRHHRPRQHLRQQQTRRAVSWSSPGSRMKPVVVATRWQSCCRRRNSVYRCSSPWFCRSLSSCRASTQWV